MPIIKCFVSSDLKTKFNSEYIDSVSSTGNQKFSEYADYVFCYCPKYYEKEGKHTPEIFVTKKKLATDQVKFRKYFDALVSKFPKEGSENGLIAEWQIHEKWIESKLGKNWKELITNFCEKFLKINGITNLTNQGDRLLLALTKDDWKKIKSKIKPDKVEKDLNKMYDENYNGSDLSLIELKKN